MHRFNYLLAAAAVLAATALSAAACSSSAKPQSHATTPVASGGTSQAATAGSSSAPGAVAPNPVDILMRISGCQFDQGETEGDTALGGDRYASCYFNDNIDSYSKTANKGTVFTVYTSAAEHPQEQFATDDSHKIITGDQFILEITGDWSSTGYSQDVVPAAIASEVNGTVQQ